MKGIDRKFGLLGAVCAAFGWAFDTVLGDVAFLAQARHAPYLDVLRTLNMDRLSAMVTAVFQPLDVLFLALAVYEGYTFSFRVKLKRALR